MRGARLGRAAAIAGAGLLGAAVLAVAETPPAATPPAATPPAERAAPMAYGPPPGLTATVDTTAVTVGAPLELVVEAAPAEGWLVEPPNEKLPLDPFRVRSVERLERVEGSAWRLRLVPLSPGDVEIPPIELVATGPGGAKETVSTRPVPVSVASNLAPEEAAAVSDPAAPGPPDASGPAPSEGPERAEYKPALEAPRNWWPVAAAFAAFALAAVLGFWILRRLRARARAPGDEARPAAPRTPPRPAWETALETLDRIAAAAYPDRGEIDRQYVEVTEALRRYLEERYGVPALESTTDELRLRFRGSPVPPPVQTRVLAILREADFVKFAKARPAPSDARGVEVEARRVVTDTIPGPSREEAVAA